MSESLQRERATKAQEAIPVHEGTLTLRAYASWKGITATRGEVSSSFSNLRLEFMSPVADGGDPGLTTPEELLLAAAITAWCTAFARVAGQMVLDVADVSVYGELTRTYDEIEGHRVEAIMIRPEVTMRTGLGFEKVHDMFRRATALARQQSPVLRALAPAVRLQVEPSYR